MICTANRNGASSSRYITARQKKFTIRSRAACTALRISSIAMALPIATGANTQNTTLSSGIRLVLHLPVQPPAREAELRRRLEQLLLRPDRVLARGEGQLEVVRERQRARGAGLDAQTAHDAAQVVDLVVLREPLPRTRGRLRVVVLPLHPDRVGRARERTQLATDALLQAVLVTVQQVAAHVRALRDRRDLLRVPLGVVTAERLLPDGAHPLGDRPGVLEEPTGLLLHGPLRRAVFMLVFMLVFWPVVLVRPLMWRRRRLVLAHDRT